MKKSKTIKKSYKYCETCGKKLVDVPIDNKFNVFTGEQDIWLQCPDYKDIKGVYREVITSHSRWVKTLVTNIEYEL